MHFSNQFRSAVRDEITVDPAFAPDAASGQERNRELLVRLGARWKALDDAAKLRYKEDAPMVETKIRKKASKPGAKPSKPKAKKATPAKDLFAGGADAFRQKQTSMTSFFAPKPSKSAVHGSDFDPFADDEDDEEEAPGEVEAAAAAALVSASAMPDAAAGAAASASAAPPPTEAPKAET